MSVTTRRLAAAFWRRVNPRRKNNWGPAMNLPNDIHQAVCRRHFFRDCSVGLGSMALASLLGQGAQADPPSPNPLRPRPGHFPAKAKNVIFLFMAGGPSHLELFDPKPVLQRLDGQTVPESFTRGRRFAFIRPDAKLLGTRRRFSRAGQVGAEISEALPHTAGIVDDI